MEASLSYWWEESRRVIQSRLPTTVTNLIKGAQEPILQRIPDLIHLTNENNTQTSLQYRVKNKRAPVGKHADSNL